VLPFYNSILPRSHAKNAGSAIRLSKFSSQIPGWPARNRRRFGNISLKMDGFGVIPDGCQAMKQYSAGELITRTVSRLEVSHIKDCYHIDACTLQHLAKEAEENDWRRR